MKTPPPYALPIVVAAALLLRVWAAFLAGGDPLVHDSKVYLAMADGIVNEAPLSSFPNGYPLIIAILRLGLSGDPLVKALLGLNVLFSTAAVWMTARLGRLWFPERPWVGLAAAAAMAVFPHQLRYVQLVMSEAPSLFFATLALWLLFENEVGGRWRDPEFAAHRFGAGLLLHATMAIRPSLTLMFPLAALALLAFRRPWKGIAVVAAGFAVGVVLLFGIEKAGFVRRPVAPDNNLLIAISSNSAATEFTAYPAEQQAQAKRLYVQFALRRPGEFLKQRAVSLWELWGPKSLPGYRLEQEGAVIKAVIVCRTLLLALALTGLWRHRRDARAWLLFAPVLGLTVVHVLTFSNHRFLAPIEPSLFLLSVSAFPLRRSAKAALPVE